jgi:gamma-glutamyltranspeptidase/glutathione hydrolase
MLKHFCKPRTGIFLVLVGILILFLGTTGLCEQVAIGTEGMVASAHELASAAGAEILAAGGNAIDAAVATAFAITVVEPDESSLGGEGYMVLSLADGRDVAIDCRSWAPGYVTIETDACAKPYYGPTATCIPGLVAGLTLALNEYGTMTLAEVMAPAIRIAREGFPLDDVLFTALSRIYDVLTDDPVVGPIYFPDGVMPEPGSLMVNEDLACALELIAEQGAHAFYHGEISDALVTAMDGWITHSDLQRYQAVEREPIISEYRGYEIIGAPPIVAGIVVAETLNILENFDLSVYGGWDDPAAIHLISQALLLASADRLHYIGDPDFYDVPIEGLLSEEYARLRAALIDPEQAIKPTQDAPVGDPTSYMPVSTGALDREESQSTTHISVLDKDGNAVSLTQTISSMWGSRDMIPGYGFFMNNELHNFNNYNPDYPDDVNVVGPYKRPRTVLAPTVVRNSYGEVFLVLGTPGGGRIPSTVTETIINVIDFGMSLEEAMRAPKFCSRVVYPQLQIEKGYSADTIAALKELGHTVITFKTVGPLAGYFGGINAIIRYDDGTMVGVGSFRRAGGAAGP